MSNSRLRVQFQGGGGRLLSKVISLAYSSSSSDCNTYLLSKPKGTTLPPPPPPLFSCIRKFSSVSSSSGSGVGVSLPTTKSPSTAADSDGYSSIPSLLLPCSIFCNTNNNRDRQQLYPYCLVSLSDLHSSSSSNNMKKMNLSSNKKLVRHRRLPWDNEYLFPDDARYVGSSHGWLAYIHPRTLEMFLLNPLHSPPTDSIIPLPPIETRYEDMVASYVSKSNSPLSPSPLTKMYMCSSGWRGGSYMKDLPSKRVFDKIIMSSSPSDPTCTILAIDGCTLCFCKPGDTSWIEAPGRALRISLKYDADVVYCKSHQRFYAVEDYKKTVHVLNPTTTSLSHQTTKVSMNPNEKKNPKRFWLDKTKCHLVECGKTGDLLLVLRYYSYRHNCNCPGELGWEGLSREFHYRTDTFDVYRLNLDGRRWEPVECLGDQALFVGLNHSVSISVFAQGGIIKPNSIYFTDNIVPEEEEADYGGCDMGVFSLKDNSVEPFAFLQSPNKISPPPVWVVPN